MNLKIGDIVVPRGCSTAYQKLNKITVQHIKKVTWDTICDGEPMTGKYKSASANGWSWYPVSGLEKWTEPGVVER